MKKITALILCFILLLPLCACSKKINLNKTLPDTAWDNHSVGISIRFDKDGICTVSNSISMEVCTYATKDERFTINGAVSFWKGEYTEDGLVVEGMKGFFEKTKEHSYYPTSENYGYVIKENYDEAYDQTVYDLSFWHGYYSNMGGYLTLGSTGIHNMLTYTISRGDGEHYTNGSVKATESDRYVLVNDYIRITLSDGGAILEALDEEHKKFEGTYVKTKK